MHVSTLRGRVMLMAIPLDFRLFFNKTPKCTVSKLTAVPSVLFVSTFADVK